MAVRAKAQPQCMLQNVDQDGPVGCLQDKGSIWRFVGAFLEASLMSLNLGTVWME